MGLLFIDGETEYLGPNAGRGTSPNEVVESDGICCFCL
jgi:hypothetical protein